jgi:hypothetical protein
MHKDLSLFLIQLVESENPPDSAARAGRITFRPFVGNNHDCHIDFLNYEPTVTPFSARFPRGHTVLARYSQLLKHAHRLFQRIVLVFETHNVGARAETESTLEMISSI